MRAVATRFGRTGIPVLLLALALLPAGCGTEGVTSLSADPDGGGISGTGVAARGTIEAFGSVFVNGTEFVTDAQTEILVEGVPATEGDLRLGMVVTIAATRDARGVVFADRIEYADEVEGPLVGSPAAGTVQVLGRPVELDCDAVRFEGASCDDLEDGDLLEVSGFVEADGTVVATYVERKKRADEFDPDRDGVEIGGAVTRVDAMGPGSGTLEVEGVTVRFGPTTVFEPRVPEVGDRVKVEGRLMGAGGDLFADEVEVTEAGLPEGAEVELEGVVGSRLSDGAFRVDGVRVDIAGAVFDGGTVDDFQPGARVEIEGFTGTGGLVVAERVEIERRSGPGPGPGHGSGGGPGDGPGPGGRDDDEEEDEDHTGRGREEE